MWYGAARCYDILETDCFGTSQKVVGCVLKSLEAAYGGPPNPPFRHDKVGTRPFLLHHRALQSGHQHAAQAIRHA